MYTFLSKVMTFLLLTVEFRHPPESYNVFSDSLKFALQNKYHKYLTRFHYTLCLTPLQYPFVHHILVSNIKLLKY